MSVIGTFMPTKDGGWVGTIRTLTIDAKVRLVPNDNRDSVGAPLFRVLVGQCHIGNAWAARSGGDNPRDYLRVRFDEPGWHEGISAALFIAEDRASAQLVWSRRRVDG